VGSLATPHAEQLLSRGLSVLRNPISATRGLYHLTRGDLAQPDYFGTHIHVEKAPDRNNRVTLSRERDANGLRRASLHWTFGEQEKDSLRRTVALIDAELRAAGIGRLEADLSDPALARRLEPTHHHMGTTRMHPDEKHGVVDTDSRVHGISNLFVAGSSVFPTSGAASVTMSTVALAVRLADHVRARLAGSKIDTGSLNSSEAAAS